MRPAYFVMSICALLVCGSGGAQSSLQAQSAKGKPLILILAASLSSAVRSVRKYPRTRSLTLLATTLMFGRP